MLPCATSSAVEFPNSRGRWVSTAWINGSWETELYMSLTSNGLSSLMGFHLGVLRMRHWFPFDAIPKRVPTQKETPLYFLVHSFRGCSKRWPLWTLVRPCAGFKGIPKRTPNPPMFSYIIAQLLVIRKTPPFNTSKD